MFEDTKGVIRIRISKNRQHNGQKRAQQEKQRSTIRTALQITKKGALDPQPQVLKFSGGSLTGLRLLPPLKLVAML
jgi:hypothetical protein